MSKQPAAKHPPTPRTPPRRAERTAARKRASQGERAPASSSRSGRRFPGCGRRPRAAAAASCGRARPRPCSARAREARGSCSSARCPATARTARGGRSSGRRGASSTARSRPRDRARRRLRDQRRQALQVRGARQAPDPPDAQEGRGRRLLPWLDTEIKLVRPTAVVALGATAAKALLGCASSASPSTAAS